MSHVEAGGDPRIAIADDGHTPIVTAAIPGHRLLARGEPYLAVDCYQGRCSTNLGATTHQENTPSVDSVRGHGHGACECGALSEHEPTGAARRRWHRKHKARVLLELTEPDQQPAAVPPEAIA